MSGGGVRWEERGIIPRAFSHLFDEIDKLKCKTDYKIYGSYLEIYNECGYDLLDE
jgi:kinesin family member 6/9